MAQIEFADGMVQIDPEVVAEGLGIDTQELRLGMREGRITSRFERGEGEDAGRVRLTFLSQRRRLRITADDSGTILKRSAADIAAPPRHG